MTEPLLSLNEKSSEIPVPKKESLADAADRGDDSCRAWTPAVCD
jgi:hypothetical protein